MRGSLVIAQQRVGLRDPHDCSDQADDLAILETLFDALVRRGPDGRFRPALAQSWTVSDDARVWTFRLRPNLRFHDGALLDAEAVAFSICRMQRPDIGATLGAPSVWRQYLADAEIAAVDRATVRIALATPIADLLDILVSGYVLPPDLADRADFLKAPVGSGAYRLAEISSDAIRMTANPDWHGGRPAFADLTWRRIAAADDRIAAVASGGADVATRLEPSAPTPAGVRLADYVDPVSIIYMFNCRSGPLQDARIRRALNLGIDRQALIRASVAGAGAPLAGPVSGRHFGAAPGVDAGPDIAGARRLLAEAGFGAGLTLTIDRPTSLPDEAAPLTDALVAQFAHLGVACDVRVHADRVAYAEMVRDKRIGDMCLFDSSPMSFFRVIYEKLDSRRRGAWWQGYADDQVETLLDRARQTADEADRAPIYQTAYRRLTASPPWLYLYNRRRGIGFSGDAFARLQGSAAVRVDGVLDLAAAVRAGTD